MNYSRTFRLIFPSFLCLIFLSGTLSAQRSSKRGVRGNGNVIKESREVGNFHSLDIGGIFEVVLRQGNGTSLEIEADENLMEYIEVRESGNTLEVSLRKGINLKEYEEMNLYISMDEVETLSLSGMVSLKGETQIQGDEIVIDHGGMGTTDLDLFANKLEANIHGMSKLKLEGKVNQVFLDNSGMGSIHAEDLKATRLTIDNSGMGNADVYATTEIDISSSGMGKVTYSGEAEVKSVHSSGMAKVKRKK
ncbi:MAG: head GIN domain-containing protein [Bacteroidota bacterium]